MDDICCPYSSESQNCHINAQYHDRDRAGRREWVTLFRNALGPKGRVRFVAFLLPKSVAFHLNTFRVSTGLE